MNIWSRPRKEYDATLACTHEYVLSEPIRRWLLYIDCGGGRIGMLDAEVAVSPEDAIWQYRTRVDGLMAEAVRRLPLRAIEVTMHEPVLHFAEQPRRDDLHGWFGLVIDDAGVCACRHSQDETTLRRALAILARRIFNTAGEIISWRYRDGVPIDTYSEIIELGDPNDIALPAKPE